ncbi:MAG: hypothetical protein R2867_29610 [Caldilineaceae bacterium]
MPYTKALKAATVQEYDFVTPYVDDLNAVVDMAAIAAAGIKIGVDPMGGAGVNYWEPIAEKWPQFGSRQPPCRSHLCVHDRGQGWQDPHGLFLALCDGVIDRSQGSLRHRLWQRSRY